MITILHWTKCIIVQELTLVEFWALGLPRLRALAAISQAYSSTAIITGPLTILLWFLLSTDAYMLKLAVVVQLGAFCLPVACLTLASTKLSLAAWQALQWIISAVSTWDIESLLVCLKYPNRSKALFSHNWWCHMHFCYIATTWRTLYIRKVYTEPSHCSQVVMLPPSDVCQSAAVAEDRLLWQLYWSCGSIWTKMPQGLSPCNCL